LIGNNFDEEIKKCNGILFRLSKKREIWPFQTWMNPEAIMPNEISQGQKDKYHTISHTREF
jgi:hypothetical protein